MDTLDDIFRRLLAYKGNISDDIKNLEPSEIVKIIAKIDDVKYNLYKQKRRIKSETTNDNPKLLTLQEAADYLKVSKSTIINIRNSGKIGGHTN